MDAGPCAYCKALGFECFERSGFALIEGGMLEEHHQIIRNHDPSERGLGCPEVFQAEALQSKILLQFLDPVFAVGATIVEVAEHRLDSYRTVSGMRRNQISCVALPTCGLALAESERYLPNLVADLEATLEEVGLLADEIVIRSTGCPNGCGRPYLGEIGLVGKVPGKYNLYLGAGFDGQRMNKLYRSSLTHEQILETLRPILVRYAKKREDGERFGDFCIRTGYVKPTLSGATFHDDVPEEALVK